MLLLIVDDHLLVAQGMCLVLQAAPELADVQCLHADTCAGAFELIRQHRDIDLVLLDYLMPDMNGLDALQRLRHSHPELPVLMVTGQLDAPAASRVIEAGASGFLNKSGAGKDLLQAVKTVLAGGVYWPRSTPLQASRQAGDCLPFSLLSVRQMAVLRLLIADAGTSDIHRALFISEPTVKYHVREILKKLRVASRSKAVALAVQAGIRPLDPPGM